MTSLRVRWGVTLALLALSGTSIFLLQRHRKADTGDTRPWRRVLAFDVAHRHRDFKADLGNKTIVIAHYESPIGWEVGVYAYPVAEDADNLLADDKNWRGSQPWQSFAWTQRKKLYPDTRVIEYGKPKQALKIILKDCKTAKKDGTILFLSGRLEVYHLP